MHPRIYLLRLWGYCLNHAVERTRQLGFIKHLPLERNRQFDRSVKLMNDIVDQVIKERKNEPEAGDEDEDLLGFMLNARDEHDLGLSDENIRCQVVAFLIAAHDTTANTLAWALYELSQNPKVEAKVLQEIANAGITHDEIPTVAQISELKYMHQVFKETLRKYPPLRQLGEYCKKDCIVPEVYPDPERFDPDRFSPEEEQRRSRFAWLPFSTGPRSCIGMAFALQEAKIVLAMLLHRYKFRYDGPPVDFDPQMATIKPKDFLVNILPRTDMPQSNTTTSSTPTTTTTTTTNAHDSSSSTLRPAAIPKVDIDPSRTAGIKFPPITFLYGSQTGTAQDYAAQLASQARGFDFDKVTFCEMDKWNVLETGKYNPPSSSAPQELVVISTATYNGQPLDCAERFSAFVIVFLTLCTASNTSFNSLERFPQQHLEPNSTSLPLQTWLPKASPPAINELQTTSCSIFNTFMMIATDSFTHLHLHCL
ncbi:cytochrome p450 [Lichtheimia corymbifera JMRC:FSU:9682]|uniref:Cytochrome p450 n=1 Tax=Lichtheimia corymbifera JMRC:FSU:9682 TaxID=1263082 RepID=A0A068RKB6_9FUNG|nr:cytochrome p450 [Lichtheimia corymbifera JMRC:FSU:9682]